MSPLYIIVAGFCLVVVGMVLPFLMTLRIIESTFLLNFLAFTCSLAGLLMGMIGAASYVKTNRGRK
jgi:hypothetical protein